MLEITWNEHKSNIGTFTIVWWKQQPSPPVYGVDPVSSVIIALWFMSNFFWRQISLNCYMKLFWARQIWLNCFTRLICLGPRRVLWTRHNVLSHISIVNRNHFFLSLPLPFSSVYCTTIARYGQFNINPYRAVCNYSAFTCFPRNWYIIFLCLTSYCACSAHNFRSYHHF